MEKKKPSWEPTRENMESLPEDVRDFIRDKLMRQYDFEKVLLDQFAFRAASEASKQIQGSNREILALVKELADHVRFSTGGKEHSECIARGTWEEQEDAKLAIGTMFGRAVEPVKEHPLGGYKRGQMYAGMVFTLAGLSPDPYDRHGVLKKAWATRPRGDSLGPDNGGFCVGSECHSMSPAFNLSPDDPVVVRMVEFLESQKVEPLAWAGPVRREIPFAQYVEEWAKKNVTAE